MSIKISYTPVGATGEAAVLAGQAQAIKREQDKKHQRDMQKAQIAATHRNVAAQLAMRTREALIRQDGARSRQAQVLQADITKQEYRFNNQLMILEKSYELGSMSEIQMLNAKSLIDVENESRLMEIEKESRRQWDPQQQQLRATINDEIQKILNDPSLSDEEKQVAVKQKRATREGMKPMGIIPETPAELWKANTHTTPEGDVWTKDSKGVWKLAKESETSNGDFDKEADAAYKQVAARNKSEGNEGEPSNQEVFAQIQANAQRKVELQRMAQQQGLNESDVADVAGNLDATWEGQLKDLEDAHAGRATQNAMLETKTEFVEYAKTQGLNESQAEAEFMKRWRAKWEDRGFWKDDVVPKPPKEKKKPKEDAAGPNNVDGLDPNNVTPEQLIERYIAMAQEELGPNATPEAIAKKAKELAEKKGWKVSNE